MKHGANGQPGNNGNPSQHSLTTQSDQPSCTWFSVTKGNCKLLSSPSCGIGWFKSAKNRICGSNPESDTDAERLTKVRYWKATKRISSTNQCIDDDDDDDDDGGDEYDEDDDDDGDDDDDDGGGGDGDDGGGE